MLAGANTLTRSTNNTGISLPSYGLSWNPLLIQDFVDRPLFSIMKHQDLLRNQKKADRTGTYFRSTIKAYQSIPIARNMAMTSWRGKKTFWPSLDVNPATIQPLPRQQLPVSIHTKKKRRALHRAGGQMLAGANTLTRSTNNTGISLP